MMPMVVGLCWLLCGRFLWLLFDGWVLIAVSRYFVCFAWCCLGLDCGCRLDV